ncbi:MAG TPA: B12-binding domain-containing radical SAM protein [Candidatus Wunengus sp. YC61]|uniref:B12-binding domain-containing radical SAM protein n=1 Tax=Candidatus Wunengus sp. YC61 TaxID=3367698 RepID=UPI0040253CCE
MNSSLFYQIDFFNHFTALPRYAPSYGLLSLMSTVKAASNNQFPIEYIDLFALGIDGRHSCHTELVDDFDDGKVLIRLGCARERFIAIINDRRPKVIGINCFTSAHHNDAVYAAGIVREATKNWKEPPVIVVGGSHPTALHEYFATHLNFDIVVRGEGDITFLELLAAIYQKKPLGDIAGITFQEEGRLVVTPDRSLLDINGIRSLPWIDRASIPLIDGEQVTSYYGIWHQGRLPESQKVTDIQTSRGCITKNDQCKHCFSGHLFGPVRRRATDDLLREMAYLANEGYTIVSDITDQVLYPINSFKEFCEGLISERINEQITIWTPNGLFVDALKLFTRKDKELMIRAGYRDYCISVEGGPQYVSQVLNKPIDIASVENILREFKSISEEIGIPIIIRAFFMVGGPGCTVEILQESTLFATDLVRKGLVDQIIPFIATPLPGTEFFSETLEAIRRILSNGKTEAKMGHLFPNGNPEKKIYYRNMFQIGNEKEAYHFFEENYIWPRLRYGMADLHSIYGLDPKCILETTAFLAALTPGMPRIG